MLNSNGFEVAETKVAQPQLANYINENKIEALLVRSSTAVDRSLIDNCPNLQLVGRGGVGLDNVDVTYAKSKGVTVINTPKASAQSVAELVFAHLCSGARFLHDANRNMPLEGDSKFKQLKKAYSNASELQGKTLGIIGFGNIGKAVAKMAIGLGMKVLMHNRTEKEFELNLNFFDGQQLNFKVQATSFEEVLANSDYITLHIPKQPSYVFTDKEFGMMKKGVGIINVSRGELIDETALLAALNTGASRFAGLDVFENEPNPSIQTLMHHKISLSPHIGGSTIEAQEKIGVELAEKIIEFAKN